MKSLESEMNKPKPIPENTKYIDFLLLNQNIINGTKNANK